MLIHPFVYSVPCKAPANSPWMSITRADIGSSGGRILGGANDSYPHGSMVKISCAPGYKFNSVSVNGSNIVRCIRGLWKPKVKRKQNCLKGREKEK